MTIVVTGATGNVGRPLVTELVRAGAHVRAVSRHPDTAGFPSEVEVLTSAGAALRGASAMFLNSRAVGADLAAVVELARSAGVTRLVALSAINVDFSAEFADAYINLLAMTVDTPALVTHEVDKILGRPAQSFAQWVDEHRAVFSG